SRDKSGACNLHQHRSRMSMFTVQGFTCRLVGKVWNAGNLCQWVAFCMKRIGCRYDAWGKLMTYISVYTDLAQMTTGDELLNFNRPRGGGQNEPSTMLCGAKLGHGVDMKIWVTRLDQVVTGGIPNNDRVKVF